MLLAHLQASFEAELLIRMSLGTVVLSNVVWLHT